MEQVPFSGQERYLKTQPAHRDAKLDETFEQIITNPNLFGGRGMTLCGGFELMTEVTDLLM